ncbi:MAG: exopolysaccharide biosynthesis polyprenyl glycosylphosphotransferase [Flavobacterium sp.]
MLKDKIHFEISERKMILHLVDIFCVFIALYAVGYFFELAYLKETVSNLVYLTVFLFYLKVVGTIFELYNLQVASNEFQVTKSAILTVTISVLAYFLTPIYSPELPKNRLQILTFLGVVFFSLVLWRVFYVRFLASNRFHQNALLLCDEDQLEELILGLANIDPHYKIIAYVNNSENTDIANQFYSYVEKVSPENLVAFVKNKNITEIVIANRKTDRIAAKIYPQLLQLLESGKVIKEYSQLYEEKTQRIPMLYVESDFYGFFPFSRSNQNHLYLLIVRTFEIVISIIGLCITVFLIPIIILGNAFGNKGSLFYTQERVGKNGVVFQILKFRTMIQNAELEKALFATTNDRRITAFGKFMRKTRIDEFPQFVNILKGDMAVIGPRPERPFFVKEIAKRMPFYETRHAIKPGLTGWAQVNYSYGETIEESLIKLQYDLYYIKHRSFYLDFSIALKTITTILFYRGQ